MNKNKNLKNKNKSRKGQVPWEGASLSQDRVARPPQVQICGLLMKLLLPDALPLSLSSQSTTSAPKAQVSPFLIPKPQPHFLHTHLLVQRGQFANRDDVRITIITSPLHLWGQQPQWGSPDCSTFPLTS